MINDIKYLSCFVLMMFCFLLCFVSLAKKPSAAAGSSRTSKRLRGAEPDATEPEATEPEATEHVPEPHPDSHDDEPHEPPKQPEKPPEPVPGCSSQILVNVQMHKLPSSQDESENDPDKTIEWEPSATATSSDEGACAGPSTSRYVFYLKL